MRILLAIGEKHLSELLRQHLTQASFQVLKDEVLHRQFLDETIEIERPDLLILHESHLPGEAETQSVREEELLRLIESWRRRYDRNLRVCIMCERERHDPFLSKLVAHGVFDIFSDRQIPIIRFIEQLRQLPVYENVSKYGIGEIEADVLKEEEAEPETEEGKKEEKPSQFKQVFDRLPKAPPKLQIHVHRPSIEKESLALMQRRIILVVSPQQRTGSTFVSHLLAQQIAETGTDVRYFENPFKEPYSYDRFAGHLEAPNYHSFYNELPNDAAYGKAYERDWKVDGVSLQVLNPNHEELVTEEEFSATRFFRMLLASGDMPYLILDIGSDTPKTVYDELAEIASQILVVFDNDLAKNEIFEQYKLERRYSWIHNIIRQEKTAIVINRYVKGAEKPFQLKNYIGIPPFEAEWVFQAQLDGTIQFSSKAGREQQQAAAADLLDLVLDEQTRKLARKNRKRNKRWLTKLQLSIKPESEQEVESEQEEERMETN